MSSLSFKCLISDGLEEVVEFVGLLRSVGKARDPELLSKVKRWLGKDECYKIPPFTFEVEQRDKTLEFSLETGTSVGIDLFSDIVSVLSSFSNVHFRAVLFDSATNGVQVWEIPEKDPLEIENKHILFCGEMEDDLDDMKELVADICTIQDVMDQYTEVLVVGHNVDQAVLHNAQKNGVTIYTEHEFWEYIEELPG